MKLSLFPGIMAALLLSVLVLFSSINAHGQVQSFEEIAGHAVGERITKSFQINDYLRHLDAESDRVSIFHIGTTYNNKRQYGVVLTSPENHARIDEIQRNGQLLNDPRQLSSSDAERIIEDQPAILYLGGSIHGFELSGTEGLLMLLEHYTTSDEPEVLDILKNTVMVVDPLINSDGRDAFAQHNHQRLGRVVHDDKSDWSNDFDGWESRKFRTSQYYFDLNRDWFAHTHPENRNRVALLREWRPQAGVDAHEMGPNTEFYVDPPTDPVSPVFPEYATRWFEKYGEAHARMFDAHNVEYTKGEIFNFFFPSYFTSYMSYQGAVGMLYEQGSSRGLALQRSDGTTRTLYDAAYQQYLAFRAMTGLSSERRADLLSDYYQAHVDAIEAGRRGTVRYFIEQKGDPAMVAETVNMLMRNGIEVHRLTEDARLRNVSDREGNDLGRVTIPAGTYVIESSQPRHNFIRALLDPEIEIPAAFLEEARKRVDRGENPRFYDTTSWSIPLLYNLSAFHSGDSSRISAERIEESVQTGPDSVIPRAAYAYLIDGAQTKALSAVPYLRAEGIRLHVLFKPTQVDGRAYESGTLVVRVDDAAEKVHQNVSELASRFGLSVDAVDSGRADAGFPPLGSVEGTRISEPKVALLTEGPLDAYSFGWAWHTLDRVFEVPHVVMMTRSVGNTPLERFNTIVMPAVSNRSALKQMLGESGVARLQRWVRDGGTLIGLGTATDFILNDLELGSLKSWFDLEENENAARVTTPGAFFRVDADQEHWLTSGHAITPAMLVNSNRVYVAPDMAPSPARNAVLTVQNDDPRISGHAWEENLERLPGSVLLWEERVGSGNIILFTEDPNFRGYWRGANRLFMNAVILGASR